MQRFVSHAILVFTMTAAVWTSVAANSAGMPALDPRLAGYPELEIRLTEDGIEAPASASPGRTLLVEHNDEDYPGHAFVMRIPDDVPDSAILEALAGPAVAEETPEWFWRAEFLGNGDRAMPGRPAVALVDLIPGHYLVGDHFRPTDQFARFEVSTPASAADAASDPHADVIAELFEMGFALRDDVPTGRQVWEIRNTGAMLHEIAIFPLPAGATAEEVTAAVSAELEVEFGGDPARARATIDALGPDWKNWSADLVAGVGVLSPQRSSWTQFDLEPGTYGAVCFVPEPTSMTPHLMMGMTDVFRVSSDRV